MLKLYRTVNDSTEYWEAWEDTPSAVIVNWGTIGDRGKMRPVSVPVGTNTVAVIEREAESVIQTGFKPVAPEEHDQVVIQYEMHGDRSRKDFDKVAKLEELMNETLGWTGLGHCDGIDIGSGTFNIFCEVVDASVACPIITADLKQHRFLEGAVIAYRIRTESEDTSWPARNIMPVLQSDLT